MNKGKCIKKLSEAIEIQKNKTNEMLDKIFKTISESMKENDELKFIGLGSIKGKNTYEKKVKRAKGEMAKVEVSFSGGSEFKKVVSGK